MLVVAEVASVVSVEVDETVLIGVELDLGCVVVGTQLVQLYPLHSGVHEQAYPFEPTDKQVAPFLHGFSKHGDGSFSSWFLIE